MLENKLALWKQSGMELCLLLHRTQTGVEFVDTRKRAGVAQRGTDSLKDQQRMKVVRLAIKGKTQDWNMPLCDRLRCLFSWSIVLVRAPSVQDSM